jgi:hypothetical protein
LRIFKNTWFSRFCRKENIPDMVLQEAIWRANHGQVDADLGGGVIKQRIARAGQGKSGGYRTIVLLRKEDKAFFVFGFGKRDQANITREEEARFKLMAKEVLGLSDKQLSLLLERNYFEEVKYHEPKI